ncbi:hypothetical protein CDL62_02065 [Alkalitalea saponilacus]|uniref:Uncharacterized protein n=1 Tax=Alkalitalea saponilacus TaxID=889453 RepID=A0A1T5EVJ6_9BACT|nr:hypothetical protein CDL62_02065 [Alkalitalea saponilacus]SKB87839.1 hypothetical protein SAMN03080601_01409 [Alkalitalea saponilacus]
MFSFYRYIFCKSYHFCINVFQEDEFPFYWATTSVVFLVFANIVSVIGFAQYYLLQDGYNSFSYIYKYAFILLMILANIYMYFKKRYLHHINYCNEISPKRSKFYRILSIIYYVVTFYAFFKSADMLRGLNIP